MAYKQVAQHTSQLTTKFSQPQLLCSFIYVITSDYTQMLPDRLLLAKC